MYINRRLMALMKGNGRSIAEMVAWYVCIALMDCARLLSWAIFFIGIVRHGMSEISAAMLVFVVAFTLLRRISEHVYASRDSVNGNHFKNRIREELFDKLFLLGPQYTDRKRCGELVNTIRQQIEWLKYYYINYIPLSLSVLGLGIAFGIYGATLSPTIGIVIILAVLGVVSAPPAFYGIIQRKSVNEWIENNRFYSDCMDGLRGLNTLKAFNINTDQRQRIDQQAEKLRKATMNNLVVTTLNSQAIELCVSVALYIPVVIGVFCLENGSITWENLLVLFMLLHGLADHSRRILGMWLRASKGIAGLDGVFEIVDAECPYSLQGGAVSTDTTPAGDICFRNVTFSYKSDEEPVLNDICLEIKEGTQTALVGASGSGKSTLARLLFGFYKPQHGSISIGSMPIDTRTVSAVQNMITAIWQDSHIFNASCFDNIHMSRPEASAEDVYDAAKKANIHKLILALPEGYDTIIGNGGTELSGGEKQRIVIARAFLRDAPILILDEATSSLDRKNEAEIQDCIRKLSQGKTVLIIAHRLDTIRHADQICVLDNGRIIERGTHEQLMKHGGNYVKLMNASAADGGDEYAK